MSFRQSFVLVAVFLSCIVTADRTSLKIYQTIQSDIFCFRRLNSTHQIGCSSHRSGNIGVVHIVDNHEELMQVVTSPPYSNYVVAFSIDFFNMGNMSLLKKAQGVQGVLILLEKQKPPPQYFSPEQSCPNRNFGFYVDTKYAACNPIKWNEPKNNMNLALGMMYEDWGMPIFIITNATSISNIRKCYGTFNRQENATEKSWPLCSIQMNSVMLAAKDSDTCMRRSRMVANLNQVTTCDPLSDKNIITSLFPTNKSEEIANKSVIVVGCRLDAFSMFDRLSPGAHSTVTGLVTLLAIADKMSSLRDEIKLKMKGEPNKNILFAIFNGEAFDYIGSSRIVYDMQKGVFPIPLDDSVSEQPALLGLNHISHFIELSQLLINISSPALWVHTDPISGEDPEIKEEAQKLFGLLKNATSKSKEIDVQMAGSSLPLPPASFQSFLRHRHDIPGIVLADHEKEFNNRYYNSIFDTYDNINASVLAPRLAEVATMVSSMLYNLITDEQPKNMVPINNTLVDGLLECYLRNASCDLFRQIADPSMTERLRVEPYPLYISVHAGGHTKANPITLYTRYMLAYITGSILQDRNRRNCSSENSTQVYQYDWMTGPEVNSSGICVMSTVMYTIAETPALELNDWKSKEYSTWTESVWLETSVRIFLQPSKSQELVTLFTGIVLFILSTVFVYLINKHASIVFNLKPLISC